ncbi:MAG: hypothetical protein AAB774_01280, partial [Patescibacteria group bacterium]
NEYARDTDEKSPDRSEAMRMGNNFEFRISNFELSSNDQILNFVIENSLKIGNSKLKITISGGNWS